MNALLSPRMRMLVALSFRSLFAHRVKNLIVGSIIFFGTTLVVVGTAVLDSVEEAMSRSIVSSLAGHIQVFSEDARDDLALFGGMFMGSEDIGEMRDFERVRQVVEAVPNVDAVVPMGLSMAAMSSGNEVDRLLDGLRAAYAAGRPDEVKALLGRTRQVVRYLVDETERKRGFASDLTAFEAKLAALKHAASDGFWRDFESDTESALTFLETKVAKAAPEDPLIYIRYLGTDLHQFARRFDRFEVVDGEMVPEGRRGFLINKKFYEDWLKHRVARELDQVRREMMEKGKRIAEDPKLRAKVKRMSGLYRDVTFQLDAPAAAALAAKLRDDFGGKADDLGGLMKDFLRVDDENFARRYDWFYREVVPHLELYRVPIGGTLTVRAYTQSGYVTSMNVKVFGTFKFTGLEASDLAGSTSLVDMVTFRELYGLPTQALVQESRRLKAQVGVSDVDRDSAESALFGGASAVEAASDSSGFDEFDGLNLRERAGRSATFDPLVQQRGLALNAAVILKDPEQLEASIQAIEAAGKKAKIGIQAVSWRTASGLVGQFIFLVRAVLYIVIGVAFAVALIIINNSMVMATMERVTEIGTIRAIGAQKSYVLSMFLLETLMLGIVAGAVGAAGGAGAMILLGEVGIAAPNDILVFLFSGPRLYPTFGVGHLVSAAMVIVLVSLGSTLYPALLAMRIQPVVAMQARE